MSLRKNCIEFLLGFCLISLVNNDEIKEPALDLYSPVEDIVQNITKVNTLLQDLIKNYEKLKKMSEPESIGDTYEDTVIHELFNGSQEKEGKKNNKPTTPAAITIRIQGTAMEVSEEEKYNTASTKPKRSERKRHNKKGEKKLRPQKDDSKINVTKSGEETTLEKENLREAKSKESKDAKELPAHLKEIAKKLFAHRIGASQETTKESHRSTTTKSTDLIIEKGSFPEIIQNGTTTTEAIKEKIKSIEPIISHRVGLVFKNNRQKERHPIYVQKSIKNLYQVAAVPSYNKKLEPAIQPPDIDSTTMEESKVIQNEESKINVLREAYGDACLKLVVRKCYMACKAVFKEVCRINHKCSPEFKQNFKKHAILGCDSSFYNISIETRAMPVKQDKNYVDMTRDGYLSMACAPISSSQAVNHPPKSVRRKTDNQKPRYVELIVNGIINPPIYRQKPNLRNRLNVTSTEIKPFKPILRADKYELACQQASRMKCYKACKHAAAEACKEEKCIEKKKTALDKACKSHCKQSYGGKDSDDDSDSEETGSESEENKEAEEEWR